MIKKSSYLSRKLNRFPRAKTALRKLLHKFNIPRHHFRGAEFHGAPTDPVTIDAPLDKIRLLIKNKWDKFQGKGKVQPGNWDLQSVFPIETLDILIAYREHIFEARPWSDTLYYQVTLRAIESGAKKWDCENKSEIDARCRYLVALYEDIRDNGYKSQSTLPDKKGTVFETHDEVTVCINRDGDLMFSDGRHRLSIAHLLQLKSIPVQVTYRHGDWQKLRDEIWAYARRMGGKVYAPLMHPDLAHIPSAHGHERFQLIKENLPFTEGDVLDIGAHWGYFCQMLEAEGFRCYALEFDSTHVHFLEKIKRAENRQFEILNQSLFDPLEKTNYDVVLALNVFHHFIKTKDEHDRLAALLARLDIKSMFFGAHKPADAQMADAYRNYSPEEFVRFILAHSRLSHSRLLGVTEDGRSLYLLTAESQE